MLKLAIFCLAFLISTSLSQEYTAYEDEPYDYVKREYHKEPILYEADDHYDELYEPKRKIEIHRPKIDLIRPDGHLLRKSLSQIHRKISNLKTGLIGILARDLKKITKATDINRRYKSDDRYHDIYDEYRPIRLEYEADLYK